MIRTYQYCSTLTVQWFALTKRVNQILEMKATICYREIQSEVVGS